MERLEKEISVPSILVQHESNDNRWNDNSLNPALKPPGAASGVRSCRSDRTGLPSCSTPAVHLSKSCDPTAVEGNWCPSPSEDVPLPEERDSAPSGTGEEEPFQQECGEANDDVRIEDDKDFRAGSCGSHRCEEDDTTKNPGDALCQQLKAGEEPCQNDSEIGCVSRQKNVNKTKLLVRSHALREAASPPPDLPSPASPINRQLDKSPQLPLLEEGPIINIESSEEVIDPDEEPASVSDRLRPRPQLGNAQLSADSSTSMLSFSLSRDSSTELMSSGSGEAADRRNQHTYTDNTGVDLQHFIIETLHRNYKDRTTLLRIEQDMIALVHDTSRTCHRFPAMSSYHRMLVHRVAAYFGMEHNVDQSGNCVVVSKSRHTRLPEVAFKEYVQEDVILPEEPSRKSSSLKRDVVSFEELHFNGRYRPSELRSQSFECPGGRNDSHAFQSGGRQRAFQPQITFDGACVDENAVIVNATTRPPSTSPALLVGARSRGNQAEGAYPAASASGTSTEDVQNLRWPRRLTHGVFRTSRIPKVESFDSRDLMCNYGNTLRPAVAKSYSFGGYTAGCASAAEMSLLRGQGTPHGPYPPQFVSHHHNYNPRFLSKQDSNSSSISISRSSPTSSGYKSQQSQPVSAAPSPTPLAAHNRSIASSFQPSTTSWNSSIESQNSIHQELSVPESETTHSCSPDGPTVPATTAAPNPPTSVSVPTNPPAATTVLWAVTNLDAVPPGSVLINPQTGQPFYNQDSTLYRFDPRQPLPFVVEGAILNQQILSAGTGEATNGVEQTVSEERREESEVTTANTGDYTEVAVPALQAQPYDPAWIHSQPYPHQCSAVAGGHPTLAASLPFGRLQPQYHYGDIPVIHGAAAPNGTGVAPAMNGYYVSHHHAPAVNADPVEDVDAIKPNCVAIPVAHGQGYVLYQACLGPPTESVPVDPSTNELNPLMKNVSLHPVNGTGLQVAYPAVDATNPHPSQFECGQNPSVIPAAFPARLSNGFNVKIQNNDRNIISSSPSAITSMSNSYVTPIRMHNGTTTIHQYGGAPLPSLGAPYHPVVYSSVPSATPMTLQAGSGQHYITTDFVHQYGNGEYAPPRLAVAVPSPSVPTHPCIPESNAAAVANVDVALNRVAVPAGPLPSGGFPCMFAPSGEPSTGDFTAGLRPSSAVFHRQYSLPATSSPALYTLGPRLQQQLTIACPSAPRPATPPSNAQQHGQIVYVSRPPRVRRQEVRSHPSGMGSAGHSNQRAAQVTSFSSTAHTKHNRGTSPTPPVTQPLQNKNSSFAT